VLLHTALFIYLIIIVIILSVVRLSPLITAATTALLYQPQMIDDSDSGAVGAMIIGRRKPTSAPLCSPQIPHDQTRLQPGHPRWEATHYPPELWRGLRTSL
jgi:hypothetical protein